IGSKNHPAFFRIEVEPLSNVAVSRDPPTFHRDFLDCDIWARLSDRAAVDELAACGWFWLHQVLAVQQPSASGAAALTWCTPVPFLRSVPQPPPRVVPKGHPQTGISAPRSSFSDYDSRLQMSFTNTLELMKR